MLATAAVVVCDRKVASCSRLWQKRRSSVRCRAEAVIHREAVTKAERESTYDAAPVAGRGRIRFLGGWFDRRSARGTSFRGTSFEDAG